MEDNEVEGIIIRGRYAWRFYRIRGGFIRLSYFREYLIFFKFIVYSIFIYDIRLLFKLNRCIWIFSIVREEIVLIYVNRKKIKVLCEYGLKVYK